MKSQPHPASQLGNVENHCTCSLVDCYCGAKVEHEWSWDTACLSPKVELFKENLAVKFNPGYSSGTALVRGNRSMTKERHHYWEVKFLTALYGTDVMIGVGTAKTSFESECYLSLLGQDRESWGLSYRGYVQHAGNKRDYCPGFIQGNLVGIHLDTWKGTLQFFVDRKPLGIAFTGLRDLQLYPMACSTAAECKMRITYSTSEPASLQMDCLRLLRPMQRAYLNAAFPGLRYLSQNIFANILQRPIDEEDDDNDKEFLEMFTILDDFDYALVGCRKKAKRIRLDETASITSWPTPCIKLETLNI